jgi:tetratricopeptide (TPR) repeat protein
MKSFLILLCGTLIFQGLNAQHKGTLDSLDNVIRSSEGTLKFDALISKVRLLVGVNRGEALQTARAAHELAWLTADTSRIVLSGRICGQLYNGFEQREEAIRVLEGLLPVAERNGLRDDYKKILINLANAYTFRAQYDKGLELHLQVLAAAEDDNDDETRGITLNNIGLAYYKLKNYKQAVSYLEKAFEVQNTLGEQFEIEKVINNIGLCYNQLKQYKVSRQYFLRVLERCKDDCHTQPVLDANLGLGVSFFYTEDFDEAWEYFSYGLHVAGQSGFTRYEADNMFWLGRIYLIRKQFDEALAAFEKVERMASEDDYRDMQMDVNYEIAGIYDSMGNYALYSQYIKKYLTLQKELYSDEVMDNLARVRADYEQRENLAIIRANEETIAIQRERYTAVVIIAFLALVLVLFLLLANRTFRRMNQQLAGAQNVIYDQNRKLSVKNAELDKMVEKKTEELKLVNLSLREMHDELDNFIHKCADDIRAPLASLKGVCHVALLDIKEQRSRDYLKLISTTTEDLSSILQRLLVLNRLNYSRPNVSPIDLHHLVDRVILTRRQKGLPENFVLRNSVAPSALIRNDEELMLIVLENTIDNALRSCSREAGKGHFVEIDAANLNGKMSVRVVDNREKAGAFVNATGLFDSSELRSFDTDVRAENLYFVKTAAKKMGGRVDVKQTSEGFNELTLVFNGMYE